MAAVSGKWIPMTWNSGGTSTAASNCTVQWSTNTTNSWSDAVQFVRDRTPRPGDTLDLPDGAKLIIDDLGNYRIEDKDAQVTYRANRMREFSPHLNASDMVARFVEYVRTIGVRQDQVLNLPLELFINWLIIEAAERDHDQVPDGVVRVEKHQVILSVKKPRCLVCQRFIPRLHVERRFPFCGLDHGARYLSLNRIGRIEQTQEA